MSEFNVVVCEITGFGPHPNADSLSISSILGAYPVIFKTGEFRVGDRVVHIPVDSICPVSDPRFAFLNGKPVRAKRLRGIFSVGFIIKADPSWEVGQNVQRELGIEKWDPQAKLELGGDNERCPFFFPLYTELESLRRYPKALQPGTRVVITEKIHGTNGRFLYKEDRLWVGSHRCIKKETDSNLWWIAARQNDLATKLSRKPNKVFFGEVYGANVQDMTYGLSDKVAFRAFDVLDLNTMKYLDYDDFIAITDELAIERVPVLYQGPWDESQKSLAEGRSTIGGSNHVREGIVIKPMIEQFSLELGGRLALKLVGEGYLTRKIKD